MEETSEEQGTIQEKLDEICSVLDEIKEAIVNLTAKA